jgi:hydrogenase nickel incorporation protein HypA/HybF
VIRPWKDAAVHELGLLHSVVTVVEKAARSAGSTRVEAVGLRVGTRSGAVLEALTGAWPIATAGTILEGAELVIDRVVAAVWCPACQAAQPIDEFFALTCPVCGRATGQLVCGREFEVTYADLAEPPDG